jgi:serine/threonine protein kinase
MPADREIARYTRGDGTEMWAIQLPCTKPRIPSESGKSTVRETEFPLLYVTKKVGSRGSDLCAGQSFEAGMYMTGYDGILLDSQMVQDKTHAISVSYCARQAIDSGGVPDWKLVEHCSLGAKSNHSYNRSNVKYIRKDWISPISNHGTSIYVQAKTQGAPHDILLGFYTSGAAERDHGIQRRPLPEGKSSIPDEAYRNYRVSSPVTEAMEVLRKDAGFDLIKICGSGSQGVVVEVKHPGHPRTFVVKIGKKRFSESERLSVLVEAALMYHASRKTDSSIGTFSSQLKSDIGWGHASVAILRASGERVAAVAMERADSDAFEICRKFCDRFTTGGIQELLPDLQSVLHGMIRAASWMHKCSYAHGDLKASNILLKRLDRAPAEHVAFCVVQGVTYQIVFGDWGHARWSGRTKDSYHLFAQEGGKPHWSSFCLEDDGKTTISSLNLRELMTVFGLRLQNPCKFPHPGAGTVTIQAPDVLRKFGDGQGLAQRLFDQAGDMWALGVISIGVFAPPQYKPAHNKDVFIRDREWAKQLRDASRSAARLKKVFRQPTASRGLHAVQMLDPVADCGSWIAGYVRKYYAQDMWPILSSCMSGQQKSDWLSLLDLQEGLLSYSSADRLTAEQALEHACFNGIMKCT